MTKATCDSPAIFARWGRPELADLYRCDRKPGHKGDHSALNPRDEHRAWWVQAYPTPSAERIAQAEAAAAALTPELEAAVLAEEEARLAAYVEANPEAVRRTRELAAGMFGAHP